MTRERILGIGVDLVGIDRFRAAYRRHGSALVDRICSEREARLVRRHSSPNDDLALRFAFKEAVLKALGTGWAEGVAFRQVELNASVRVDAMRLTGEAANRAARLGIARWIGDWSRTDRAVLAWVAGVGPGPATPDPGAR
jgi:holo-[acyl-carrier protein] synthase